MSKMYRITARNGGEYIVEAQSIAEAVTVDGDGPGDMEKFIVRIECTSGRLTLIR